MNKTELEEKIKNGESVWCVYKDQSNIYEIKAVEIEKVLSNTFLWGKEYYANIKDVYKTKAEAEHYLNHANISRPEQLPFLTWEELTSDIMAFNSFSFISEEGYKCSLLYSKKDNTIFLDKGYELFDYEATEANFYKAYDECKRLFLG